jgi:hypothetical protein
MFEKIKYKKISEHTTLGSAPCHSLQGCHHCLGAPCALVVQQNNQPFIFSIVLLTK